MTNDIRILSHFSPLIEEYLVSGEENKVFDLLKNLFTTIKSFKHTSLLILPPELLGYFYANTKLRILAESITSNTQLNIIFESVAKHHNCTGDLSKIYLGFPRSTYTHTFTNYISCTNKAAVLLDKVSFSYKKSTCTPCDADIECADPLTFTVSEFSDCKNLRHDFEVVAGTALDGWRIDKGALREDDIKGLSFLQAVLHGASESELKLVSKYSTVARFINDLAKLDDNDLIDASFCMFRTLAYPSSQTPNHHKLSIDWHPNDPYIIKPYRYRLYRVDVLPANRTGIRSSGKVRLLMAQDPQKTFFIMATDKHDFCAKTIKERLSQLP
jgi:hypothetical protein